MKIWSTLTLLVLLNFLALPSVAVAMDWELPSVSTVLSEEETHAPIFQLAEKTIPKTLNVHDFIKFFQPDQNQEHFVEDCVNRLIPPHISIISPPPEA